MEQMDKELFVFVKNDPTVSEVNKESTRRIGYFRDAWNRFQRNRSSLVSLCVLGLLVLFCLFAPFLTPYTLTDKESVYANKRPTLQVLEGSGFWDGGRVNDFTESNYLYLQAIGKETGLNPILKTKKVTERNKPTASPIIAKNCFVKK